MCPIFVHTFTPHPSRMLLLPYRLYQCTLIIFAVHCIAVLVDPDNPSIINGGVMTLSGPNFTRSKEIQNIKCFFTDRNGNDVTKKIAPRIFKRPINGIIVNCKAICPIPLFNKLGDHNLTIMVNGTSYSGQFEVGEYVRT